MPECVKGRGRQQRREESAGLEARSLEAGVGEGRTGIGATTLMGAGREPNGYMGESIPGKGDLKGLRLR